MSKHTPGPWTVHPIYNNAPVLENIGVYEIEEAHEEGKESLMEGCDPWPAIEANARLIAAAPDLLEALEWIVQPDHPIGSNAEFAQKAAKIAATAIAKAKGGAA